MAREYYDKAIDKKTDWGGDESTGYLPVRGNRVQEFIKKTLENKMGVFHYDETNNRYLVFADNESRDAYLEDPSQVNLILGTFDAPFNYSAELTLTTPNYVAILLGSKNNYIDFTFDTKNKQGQSVGEDVICTYTFIRGSVKKEVIQKYRPGTSVHFNIDDYLMEGTNTIIIGIVGQNTLAATTVSVTYQVINLQLSDSFDISSVYNLLDNPETIISVPYTVSGVGVKTMEWYLDGVLLEFVKDEDEVVETSSSRTKYIPIHGLSEGRHNVQFRAYSVVNGERFYSQVLYRDFIVYKVENLNPIIAVAVSLPAGSVTSGTLTITDIEQYVPYSLRLAVYNPREALSTLDILVDSSSITSLIVSNGEEFYYDIMLSSYGNKVLDLKIGTVKYSINLEVSETKTSLKEITDGLTLALSAIGKTNNSYDKDVWEYGNYSTTFNGFSWNKISGWVNNRLLISNGASIKTNIKPLETDATMSGRTLEFEFATRNVSNDSFVVCNLRNSSGVGILITASEITLTSSGGQKVTTKFKSEENIRVSLVINKKSGVANKLLAFIYINGILSGAVNFSGTDNFISDKVLEFKSSAEADIELKQLRFYDVALTSDQILNNYILYRDSSQEMISSYEKNNIYQEGSTSLSVDTLLGQLPVMIVTGDIPALENTTDKNLEIVVDVEYTNLQDPKRSFKMVNAVMRPQGTSSMSYPKKNFRLYTKRRDNTIVYDSDGKVIVDKLYSFKEGAQPVKTWCMKADYAESSGTHNTGIARLWNDVMRDARIDGSYICRTKAQESAIANGFNYDVRTTVDGFPILMFYRPTADDDLIFIGKYNFNNDKSTESVFGFEGIPGFDNSRMQCWEILNNGNHLALFQDTDNFDEEWEDAFEARYPDVGSDADTTNLKAFCEWVVSTKENVEKFRTEKWDHLDVYKIAAYYIYLMRFGAVDQTVKNAMLTTEDGVHFFYINYDNDTILGVRNDGLLIYPPTIDRQTLDDSFTSTVYCYAGHDSTLWNNLEADEEFMKIVSDVDNALYAAGLSYKNVINIFDSEQSDKWCERIYNQDAQYKYIGPYANSRINNLYMLQGSRKAHRRWWLSRRFNYLDAKFVSGEYRSNTFEIKLGGAPIGVSFRITSGFDMNYGYGVNNVPIETGVSLAEGESHTFTTRQVLNLGDPLRIYSAVNLKEIDVHDFIEYLSTVNMDKVYNDVLGTRLKKLILGVDVSSDDRRNSSLTEISGLISAKRLEYLDISGYKGISHLDLTSFNYFTTLKAFQSGLTSVDFAEGSLLVLAELPETLQALVLSSVNITPENLKIENTWASLRYLDIRNCPNFKSNFNYFQSWYREKSTPNRECSLTVHGINWLDINPEDLLEIGQLKLDGGTLSLKGYIKLTSSSLEIVNQLRDIFGPNCFNPNNDLYISAPSEIYLTGPTEIYEGDTAQYTAAVFSEFLGTVSYTIAQGNDGRFTINSTTGLLTSVEKEYEEKTITIRAIHRSTQGTAETKDLIVTVKPRVYPTMEIIGESIINQDEEYHVYNLGLTPANYNGIFTIKWQITGSIYSQGYVSISESNEKRCTLRVLKTTVSEVSGTLSVTMTKGSGKTTTVSLRIIVSDPNVIMTSSSNPEVMRICYEQGWAASSLKMTKQEAASVTSIGTVFRGNTNIRAFPEFQYFTGVTQVDEYAFEGCTNLGLIYIPPGDIRLKWYSFDNCPNIELNQMFDKATNVIIENLVFMKNWGKYDYIVFPESVKECRFRFGSVFSRVEAYGELFQIESLEKNCMIENLIVGSKKITWLNGRAIDHIKNLTFLDGLEDVDVGGYPFEGFVGDVVLPKSVNTIDQDFLKRFSNGVRLIIEEGGDLYVNGGNIYRKSRNSLYRFYSGNIQEVIDSVGGIEDAAFWEISQQGGTIIIGDNIMFFEGRPWLKGLDSFILRSKHITTIGDSTSGFLSFQLCEYPEVIIESPNIVVWEGSFTSSKISSVRILGGCTLNSSALASLRGEIEIESAVSIGDNCFAGCVDVKTLKINSNVAPLLGNDVFKSRYSETYMGSNTASTGENRFIIPAGSTGYDTGQWLDPLCNPDKCGFTLVEEV